MDENSTAAALRSRGGKNLHAAVFIKIMIGAVDRLMILQLADMKSNLDAFWQEKR